MAAGAGGGGVGGGASGAVWVDSCWRHPGVVGDARRAANTPVGGVEVGVPGTGGGATRSEVRWGLVAWGVLGCAQTTRWR